MAEEQQLDLVTHNISLDAHELFTQLSITAALVQVGPRRGVFLSFIDIVDKRNPRLWRGWLAESAMKDRSSVSDGQTKEIDNQLSSMIWADEGKTMGLKVRVKEKKWRGAAPIMIHKDEDPAISYSLELQELLISTTHLLLAVEKSLLESRGDGKAMIFGSFAAAPAPNGAAA
ncbi:MAG: hypothetical protein Q9168_003322 [Polycauliona sp. 1 TL-2023]